MARIVCSLARTFREEREHTVSHQVDGLCHDTIATAFQAINAAREDRSHVSASQCFSLHQVL
jgi:hypothetical protein